MTPFPDMFRLSSAMFRLAAYSVETQLRVAQEMQRAGLEANPFMVSKRLSMAPAPVARPKPRKAVTQAKPEPVQAAAAPKPTVPVASARKLAELQPSVAPALTVEPQLKPTKRATASPAPRRKPRAKPAAAKTKEAPAKAAAAKPAKKAAPQTAVAAKPENATPRRRHRAPSNPPALPPRKSKD